jgi:hypothetical protein
MGICLSKPLMRLSKLPLLMQALLYHTGAPPPMRVVSEPAVDLWDLKSLLRLLSEVVAAAATRRRGDQLFRHICDLTILI